LSRNRITLGNDGEQLAAQYLLHKGYTILEKNFRTRCGEIDIVAKDGNTMIFVEVKTRTSESHGSPFHSITPRKMKQISKVALEYLSKHDLFENDARFDVIAILQLKSGSTVTEHLTNAFDLCYGF